MVCLEDENEMSKMWIKTYIATTICETTMLPEDGAGGYVSAGTAAASSVLILKRKKSDKNNPPC